MVLDALYYSKFQKELQQIIQDCYNMKRVFFNFTPYNKDADSLELDYLILISACTINGKRIRLQDMYTYNDDQKAIKSIASSKKNAKELLNNFLVELEKIIRIPDIDFSEVAMNLSKKNTDIDNLMGVSNKEAVSFLDSFLKYYSHMTDNESVKEEFSNITLQIKTCNSNDEIMNIINSFFFLEPVFTS